MGAKDLRVLPIARAQAVSAVERWHYSGRCNTNSQLFLGAVHRGRVLGAMAFGPPMDRRKVLGLVSGSKWASVLELNRLAFSDILPRNSESRALGYAAKFIAGTYPNVEWLLSYADGCQCGDGTIYRAAGWLLTGVNPSARLWAVPDTLMDTAPGRVVHEFSIQQHSPFHKRVQAPFGGRVVGVDEACAHWGGELIPGHMLRYIKPLRPGVAERITVPILPYSAIAAAGASMYRGQRAPEASGMRPANQQGEGGSTPTPALHPSQSVGE